MSRWGLLCRVLLVAFMSFLLPTLKGNSLQRPLMDVKACEEAAAAGASCELCTSRLKFCRGHHVYEPFTVVLFEAFATMCVGTLMTFLTQDFGDAASMLFNWEAWRRVAPVGATFAVGDVMDLLAAKSVSSATLQVSAQMRLPMCAMLRSAVLDKSQSAKQWITLSLICIFCVACVICDVGTSAIVASAAAIPLLLSKSLISCAGAVHAEYFLQNKSTQKSCLWVTQVHFKMATMVGAIIVGIGQGRKGRRIMATQWQGELFTQFPPGVKDGDPRVPFFGGWDFNTFFLVFCLVCNNFLVGDALRHLSSVSKYVAYAFGMVFSYGVQVYSSGGRNVDVVQAMCFAGVGFFAIIYSSIEEQKKSSNIKKD